MLEETNQPSLETRRQQTDIEETRIDPKTMENKEEEEPQTSQVELEEWLTHAFQQQLDQVCNFYL